LQCGKFAEPAQRRSSLRSSAVEIAIVVTDWAADSTAAENESDPTLECIAY
jgi:hypothetical protein